MRIREIYRNKESDSDGDFKRDMIGRLSATDYDSDKENKYYYSTNDEDLFDSCFNLDLSDLLDGVGATATSTTSPELPCHGDSDLLSGWAVDFWMGYQQHQN